MQFTVDVHNPAEVFAAFGILELISRQDASVVSCFETDSATGPSLFVIETSTTFVDLRSLEISELEHQDPLIAPVLLDDLRLDWWLNQWKDDKNPPLKLWSGTNRPAEMLRNYQQRLPERIEDNILQTSIITKAGKASFGFDLRASRDALRLGYSQKEAGDASLLFPAAEFLCAVGLQNFRPSSNLEYFVWRRPIPVSIAHAACRKEIPGLKQSKFTMAVRFVGQGLRAISEVSLTS